MPTPTYANAYPRKRFFLEMFTRDISFEDCILDLIDNSIDSLVRDRDLDPAKDLFSDKAKRNLPISPNSVDLSLEPKEITVKDDCGGIPKKLVQDELFTFGHSEDFNGHQQLGIYGVGLKRAIFKIAEEFEMFSSTGSDSFRAKLNIPKWAEKDEDPEDWKVPVTFEGAQRTAGTQIRFSPLREEVKMRLRDPAFFGRLTQSIAQTYSLFLERYVQVNVNRSTVLPEPIPLGAAEGLQPGQSDFSKGGVHVRIFCGLAARAPMWTHEKAGWYVLCNGRVVVTADKTDLTGWNVGLPSFHSKYKGFVGVVVFRSKDPLLLPWTTTKRGLNRESPIYQDVKREMILLARPIISFINNMYRSDSGGEEPEEREVAGKVVQADLRKLASQRPSPFKPPTRLSASKTSTKVQYEAEVADIDRVKKALRQPKWSANKVGKYTFDHFLKKECPQ